MRLRVTRYYRAGNVEYQPGTVLTIDDPGEAAWLIRDGNGGIEELKPEPPVTVVEARTVDAPPQDRMARTRKRRGK